MLDSSKGNQELSKSMNIKINRFKILEEEDIKLGKKKEGVVAGRLIEQNFHLQGPLI